MLGENPESETMVKRPTGEIEIGVPTWLDWALCCAKIE